MPDERVIGGQQVSITPGGNFLLNIEKGLYFSAGKKYGFPLNSPGVGVNEHIVLTAIAEDRWIVFGIEGNKYIIHPKEILEICSQFNSTETHKDTLLYVVPIRSLKRLGG